MKDQGLLQRRLAEARRWKKTTLELKGLILNTLPTQILYNPFQFKIVSLDLSFNRISSLQGIDVLKNLQTLCARSNLLKDFPPGLARLHSLTVLDLAHNKIRDIPSSVGRLHELKVVNLSCNDIRYLPDSLIHCCKLERLHVNKNPIKNVPRDVFVQGLCKIRIILIALCNFKTQMLCHLKKISILLCDVIRLLMFYLLQQFDCWKYILSIKLKLSCPKSIK